MKVGSPVIFSDAQQGRQFRSLAAISTRRDDPHSFEEKLLQDLIAESPEVLPVGDFFDSKPRAVFSLGREVPVDIGGSDGYIDNLLVTADGYMVIVETKLYRNPEATRDVVTQTLQYGMAVCRMPVLELEAKIRRGQNSALRVDESIRDCVSRVADEQGQSSALGEDFEEAFEQHLRRGEILLLVVSDGIRIGVERVTHWLNEQGSSTPFRFGLVELKFYTLGDQRLAIPRTVLKTREVSRHVVVVDITPTTEVRVNARVTDDFHGTAGGKVQESRPIKAASVPLTKGTLLQLLRDDDRQAASAVIEQLEVLGFDQEGTPSSLKFGFTADDGTFHMIANLNNSGVWLGPYKVDADRVGPEPLLDFKREANGYADFYRPDQLTTKHNGGCAGRYRKLEPVASEFAAFLDGFRAKLIELSEAVE
jgi:hypothetical protein